MQAQGNLTNLVDEAGRIDINQASGQFGVQTDQPIAIAPVASFAEKAGIHGLASIDLKGTLDRGSLQADLRGNIDDLYTEPAPGPQAEAPATQPRPIDVTLAGQVQGTTRQATARLDLGGGPGTAQAQVTYAAPDQPARVDGEELLAALLTGKPVSLPNVTLETRADLNLQAIGQAVPQLLRLREDTEITRGTLRIENLHVQTVPQLAATGAIQVSNLAAAQKGQPIEWEPIALNLNARVVPDVGLQVEQAQLQSGFAQAQVAGTPADMQGRFSTDLARLDQQLRQLVQMGDFRLAGGVEGTFQLARVNDSQVNFSSRVNASNVQYASGDRRLRIDQAAIDQNEGSLVLADQRLQRVEIKNVQANVDRQVLAQASGVYSFQGGGWQTDATVQQAQMPYLLTLARNLGIRALDGYQGYSGTVENLAVSAAYDPQAGAITSNGQGAIGNLAVDEEPVADSISLRWQEVAFAPDTGRARLRNASLQAPFAELTAADVQYQPGDTPAVSGQVRANAQLQPTFAAVYRLARREQPPAVAGQLEFRSDVATQGQVVTLSGQAVVDGLQVGTGEQTVQQDRVQFAYDAQVDNQRNVVTVRRADLESNLLAARVNGTVEEFRSRQMLNLSGQYSADWDQVMPLLYEVSPGLREKVALAGSSRSDFRVSGPAHQPDARPVFRGVTTDGFAIGWASGKLAGLELGQAQLQPRLNDGRLDLPTTAIPASGGTLNIGGIVDLTPEVPWLRIPGELRALDNINLNSEIGRELLSYINPLFSEVAGIDGRASLVLTNIDIPLGEPIQRTGTGRGKLDLQNVRLQPGGTLGTLAQIAGVSLQPRQDRQMMGMRIGSPEFEIRDGRIHYDNFAMIFPNGVEMVYSGSVGFDGSVNLFVGVPVTPGLLTQFGVAGPVVPYAAVLKDMRVDVPIVGSRTAPKLDFAKVNIKPLIEQAARKLTIEGGLETARDLLPVPKGVLPGDRPAEGRPALPGEGIIRGVLPGGQKEQAPQTQPSPQTQQRRGLPGQGLLRELLPGQKDKGKP